MSRRFASAIKTLAILVPLLASGCFGSAAPDARADSGAASSTDKEPIFDARPPVAALPSGVSRFGLNTTNCLGAQATLYMPAAVVNALLPEAYQVSFAAHVMLQVMNCTQVAVDGIDVGRSSLFFVTVDVPPPSDAPPAPDLYSRFLFEGGTNNSAVAQWFEGLGVPMVAAEVTREWVKTAVPEPQQFGEVRIAVSTEAGILYQAAGLTGTGEGQDENPERYFFGPDPRQDYFD